jgi:hypothetical protein
MRVLVACEYSGVVRDAFTKAGHDATSCDLLPSESPHGKHFQGDVMEILAQDWDLLIAHPPCTYLCVSGIHWNNKRPERAAQTEEALKFVEALLNANIPKICLENPIGVISTRIRKPTQIIQPYQYGHDASKQTCLWLKNLPSLQPTKFIEPRIVTTPSGKKANRWANQCDNYGHDSLPPSADRWKIRSATYQGIADAMVEQWGGLA